MQEYLENDFEFTYFFTKDTVSIKSNLENISYEKVGKFFDNYIELEFEPSWVRKSLKINKKQDKGKKQEKKPYGYVEDKVRKLKIQFDFFRNYRRYIKELVLKIKDINPEYIVITSDMTFNYRIIKKYLPSIKVIIIQPCFLDFRKRELKFQSLVKKIVNSMLGNTLLPRQPYFGLESVKKDNLLLFDERFLSFYENKRENLFQITNPAFLRLNNRIKCINSLEIKNKLNIDYNMNVVIIYIADYTTIHGPEVQKYMENAYKELIKKHSKKFFFIIKNHPRAGVLNFERNFNDIDNILFLNSEIDNDDLLSIGDINISINSNASLQAIVSGMLTINFLPLSLKDNEHFRLLSYYGGIESNSFEDLDRTFNGFLNNKELLIKQSTITSLKLVSTEKECREKLLKAFN